MTHRKLWIALLVVMAGSFAVLGGYGPRIRASAPPLPTRVVTSGGQVVTDGESIMRGQHVWQSLGGQEVGSIWGHGAYVAPDWTADWLHREATFLLDGWAGGEGAYAKLPPERQAALRARLEGAMRRNTYDPATGTITIDPLRAEAFATNAAHYADVFRRGRDAYAI
ncbi:MAG TPA: nitric-oxide reductase large subunit, partial [Anaeromyxobacteraceae bacterium]|nr:nitric-oxide reductase large subunit [Anaeromyxobacteraceae bacterium]